MTKAELRMSSFQSESFSTKRYVENSLQSKPLTHPVTAEGQELSGICYCDFLAAIFEAKLTFNRSSSSVPSIVFVGAVDTIFPRMYRDLMLLF